jgi:hypothetical protein
MIGYGNSMFLATHGILARTASGGGVDPDAQAFITAAAITDPTQQSAINTLVTDLKGYSIWSKMEALYPMVGGTSTAHKFNLKNPLDTDAAFRMTFHGGVTHSSNGITFATNGYANTKWLPSVNSTTSNVSGGVYSRTNLTADSATFGSLNAAFQGFGLIPKFSNNITYYWVNNDLINGGTNLVANTTGFWHINKDSLTVSRLYRNGSSINSFTGGNQVAPAFAVFLGARNYNGTADLYFNGTLAFAFLGDTLDSTEAANFYTAVQAFQTTLGRSIGTQTVSDADAQAFVTNAGIVDQVEANAINNLVIGLKADSLWTKMKAIYPFVGGTSTTHKYNLVNPLDTDAAFRLVFNGGWTHSSTGALPNGTNGWANTYLIADNTLNISSGHLSIYSRSNLNGGYDMGCFTAFVGVAENTLISRWTDNKFYANYGLQTYPNVANTDSRGLFIANRNSATNTTGYKNGSKVIDTAQTSSRLSLKIMPIGALNNDGTMQNWSNRQYAFASIGDGLTDTEATNLNSRVTTFQTALNRNV